MDLKTIIYEKNDRIATLRINRPKQMNALNTRLLKEMYDLMMVIEEDDTVGAVVITGNERVFVAGADIKELMALNSPKEVNRFISGAHAAFNRIENLGKPVIAAVSGFAFGGGCELALTCDLRIASETASFALPEINLGLLPGAGGTQRLPRLIGVGRAKELIYSGDPVTAEKAHRIGLVNKVVSPDTLMDETMKIAQKLSKKPGYTLSVVKGLINEGMNMTLQAGLSHEMRCFENLFGTEDKKEGVKSFVEKRKPNFIHC